MRGSAGGLELDQSEAFVQSRSVTVDRSAGPPGAGKPGSAGTEDAAVSLRAWLIVGLIAILGFIAATNTWSDDLSPDTRNYKAIAEAAPGFPDQDIGSAFTERFVSPWVAGTLGDLLPGDAEAWLWVIVAVCVITTLVLVLAICSRLGLGETATLLCVGIVALNPYVLRIFLADPAPVDPVFTTGITVVLWGLVAQRLGYVVIGALIAILGRQTALLAVPAAMVWLYAGEGWRARPRRDRILTAGAIVGGILIVYLGLKLASSSFTYAFAPSIPGNTIIPIVGDPGSISDLVSQTARVAAPLAPIAACIAGVLIGMARAGGRLHLPVEFWCSLLIGAAIVAQPVLISPNFEGFEGNQARLSALGVVPMTVALGYALRAANEHLERASWWAIAGGACALLAGSLNDRGVVFGPETNAQFVALELVAGAVLAWLLAIHVGRRAGREPARAADYPAGL
jgi:hypothetical protein